MQVNSDVAKQGGCVLTEENILCCFHFGHVELKTVDSQIVHKKEKVISALHLCDIIAPNDCSSNTLLLPSASGDDQWESTDSTELQRHIRQCCQP